MTFTSVPDYGDEIVPGARVLDASGRRGTVVVIKDGCHWNCQEWAEQWRPRSAYVEWDDANGAQYSAPEHLARIPGAWGRGLGVVPASSPRTGSRSKIFNPTVVRISLGSDDFARVEHEWVIVNHREKGWSSFGFGYRHWRDLLKAWDVERGEPGHDEHGPFINVYNRKEAA